jgi:hypothetical protein
MCQQFVRFLKPRIDVQVISSYTAGVVVSVAAGPNCWALIDKDPTQRRYLPNLGRYGGTPAHRRRAAFFSHSPPPTRAVSNPDERRALRLLWRDKSVSVEPAGVVQSESLDEAPAVADLDQRTSGASYLPRSRPPNQLPVPDVVVESCPAQLMETEVFQASNQATAHSAWGTQVLL